MEVKSLYFETRGRENTEITLQLARERAAALGIKTVLVASTTGETAARAVEVFAGCKVVVISHVTGYGEPDVQEFTAANRRLVESQGGVIVTAAHTFAGLSRAMLNKYKAPGPGILIADTLRIFSQGMKVACEISLMAADAGLARTDEDVIAIGGSHRGADTAVVAVPACSHNFFDLRVREILCKPRLGRSAPSPAPDGRSPSG